MNTNTAMMPIESLKYEILSEWDGGFVSEITLEYCDKPLDDSATFEFVAPFEITEIWGAEILSHEGDRYVIRDMWWSAEETAEKTYSFAFKAEGNSIEAPCDFVYNGIALENGEMMHPEVETPTAETPTPAIEPPVAETPTVEAPAPAIEPPVETPISETPAPAIDQPVIEQPNPETLEPSKPSNPEATGQFSYGEALQKSYLFYEAQRSGDLPDDNRIDYRSDTGLKDGADVGRDLSGGYYDAGDHMKFGLPMAYSMSMLAWSVGEYQDAYAKSGQLDEALEAVKWGTDYFLKGIVTDDAGVKEFYGQVGQSTVLKDYWGSHESLETSGIERPSYKIDRQNPGSDLAAETAASLASASIIFRNVDSAYADKLLTNAKLMFDFAEQYQGKYSDAIGNTERKGSYESYTGYLDELGWGAAWLNKATGESSYLDKAKDYYQQATNGYLASSWTIDWDVKNHGTAVLLAQATDDATYKNDVEGFLNAWTDKSGSSGIKYTEGGLAWLTQWGSLSYTADTAMLAGIYSDTVNDGGGKYSQFVSDQVDYMLGDNPRNFSYMVGFGDNYSLQPHHQTAQGRDGWAAFADNQPNDHILYGALVGGPESADDFNYTDDRTNYISNEVALNYNAGLTGALAYMYDKFGGEALNDAELNALPDVTVANI